MKHLFLFELNYNIKKLIEHINIYMFYIISLFILSLNLNQADMPIGWLWILLVFVSLAALAQVWREDDESGVIEQWRLTNALMEWVVTARLLAYALLVLLPLAIVAVGWLHLTGKGSESWMSMAGLLWLGGIQIASVALLAASLIRGTGQVGAVAAIIVMPLAIPVILFGSRALEQALGIYADAPNASALFFAYCAFTIPLTVLATAASLRSTD